MKHLLASVFALFSWAATSAPGPMPTFEVMTGKAAEEKIRALFDGGNENPFLFQGTTPDGKPCSIKFEAPSDSEFIVSMEPGAAQMKISKMASLTRATRDFDSYFSEHYKLFIPSGTHDIVEYRKRHDDSEYQLVFQNSLDQNKWTACGKFKQETNLPTY